MVEQADGEQTSVVFLGRESFRIERRDTAGHGAIPKPVSDTPTGRIFDRRRARRRPAADEIVSARRTRSLVALLVITFVGGVMVATAIGRLRTHAVAPRPSASIAHPAPIAHPVAPPPPVAPAPPVTPPAAVVQPSPTDEPTPVGATSTIPEPPAIPEPTTAPAHRPARPERPSRPAVRSPSSRIVPPTRGWVDPFAD